MEMGPPSLPSPYVSTWEELRSLIWADALAMGVPHPERIVALYDRPFEYGLPGVALNNYGLDTTYLCSTYSFLRLLGSLKLPAYGYYNSHGPSWEFPYLPVHAKDLYFIFGSTAYRSQFSSAERTFARSLQSAIVSDAATGKPTLPEFGEWPTFEASTSGTWMNLDLKSKLINGLRYEQCSTLDSEHAYFR